MKISKITLHNFRAAKHLDIDLNEHMNLFVGVNGSGKSTVLQAINYALIALVRKINNSKKNLADLNVSDIHRFENQSIINIGVTYENYNYTWNIEQTRPGANTVFDENIKELNQLASIIKGKYNNDESLPVMVYYPVSRVIDKNLMPSHNSRNDNKLDVYNDALEGKPNFQNFFSWFRDQYDFMNQESSYRNRWIKRNKQNLNTSITKITDGLKQVVYKDDSSSKVGRIKAERFIDLDFLMHEPRFIFREMLEIIWSSKANNNIVYFFEKILRELDYMVHRMDMPFNEIYSINDSNIYLEDMRLSLEDVFYNIDDQIYNFHRTTENKKILDLVWQMLVLSLEIGLWWITDEAYENLFRDLNIERNKMFKYNSINIISENKYNIIQMIENIVDSEIRHCAAVQSNYGRDIQNVACAIEQFIPEFSNLRINRKENGTAQMLVDKYGEVFDINQLSDGEKNLIALIGDIARRLTIGNPNSKDPLKESGIIIIDEIDLHLHPKWQRIVAERITEVFPNCQFIISSHSPQVISHIKPDSIFVLKNEEGTISRHVVNESYGRTSDRILEDVMDETSRPKRVDDEIKSIFRLIQDGNIEEAKEKIKMLRSSIGDDGELIKADVLIRRREIIGK